MAFVSLVLIGGLSLAGLLPVQVLVLIVIVTSLTSILSIVGLRTIIPLMVPSYLWERANAIDANGYVVATILGPPIAASLVAFLGAPEAMIAIAIPFGLAAAALIGLREPADDRGDQRPPAARRRWTACATRGATRPSAGSGFSMTVLNLCWGAMTIIVPLIVIEVLRRGRGVGRHRLRRVRGLRDDLGPGLRPSRHARPGTPDAGRSRCC